MTSIRQLPVLRREAVALRPLAEADLEAVQAILALPGVREWWGSLEFPAWTREELRNDGRAFAIEVDGQVAGWLGFNEELDPDYQHARLDIFLAPEHQGKGHGPTALRLVLRWLFEERKHPRATIDPAHANRNAVRAYESVGFRPVGVMRRYERDAQGEWHDNLLMDLLAEELVD